MRPRLQVTLAAFGVLVATVGFAALLIGCSAHGRASAPVALDVGAAVVGSSGLGYEQGYPLVSVEASGTGALAWRASARVARSAKVETGDGVGYSGAALLGWQGNRVRLLAGPVYSAQKTSAWSKSSTYLRGELDWLPRGQELRLWYDWRSESVDGLPGGQVERVAGAAWRGTARFSPFAEAERVWFRSWGEPMVGERYLAGVVYRFGGR